jgi:hypothetical protein
MTSFIKVKELKMNLHRVVVDRRLQLTCVLYGNLRTPLADSERNVFLHIIYIATIYAIKHVLTLSTRMAPSSESIYFRSYIIYLSFRKGLAYNRNKNSP